MRHHNEMNNRYAESIEESNSIGNYVIINNYVVVLWYPCCRGLRLERQKRGTKIDGKNSFRS